MIDENEAQYHLGDIAYALCQIDLPARVAVFFIADRTDQIQSCRNDVAPDDIYDHDRLSLVEKCSCESTHIEKDKPDEQDPFAADHVIGVSQIVDDIAEAFIGEHQTDSDSDQFECTFGNDHQEQGSVDRKHRA